MAIQWGINVTPNRNPVIFPLPFSQVFTATSSTDYFSNNALVTLTNTQFDTLISGDQGNGQFRWIAIGK